MKTSRFLLYSFALTIAGTSAIALAPRPVSAEKTPGTTSDVSIHGTTITAISPSARLGLELLTLRGDVIFLDKTKRYSCADFGNNYVLVGLKVRHVVTTLVGIDLFCAPLRADGTLGAAIFRPATAPPEGTPQEVKCPAGQVVAGYKGRRDDSKSSPAHLRSITLFCSTLRTSGLTEGTPTVTTALGVNSGIAFGPDMCTGGRPARELRLTVATVFSQRSTIGAWRLGCEQPVRP